LNSGSSSASLIRIAILADRRARVRSLAQMLEEDDRLEVINAYTLGQADVLLAIDIPLDRIPDGRLPVVVLGVDRDVAVWPANLRAVLPTDVSDSEIIAALLAAASNLTVLTSGQAKQLLRLAPADDEQDPLIEHLTPRELEVLQMLAAGSGNKDIAAALGISPHTAKFHVAQIIAKLDASTRTEAVSIGIRRGLIAI
jgi:DNA-binding NarL/FixJ family response regulator